MIYSYDITSDSWFPLPRCVHESGSVAIINGWLTTVGGGTFVACSNELFSLTTERRWTNKFPPMPTKRKRMTALCTGTVLIVAGGKGEGDRVLSTVEVMNTENHQWSTAAHLPEPLCLASAIATVCGDQIYMLGGCNKDHNSIKSVYTCLVCVLLQSCVPSSLETKLERTSL